MAFAEDATTWSTFRVETGYATKEPTIDLGGFPDLVFSRTAYESALLEPAAALEALVQEERLLKSGWRRHHGLRGLIRRFAKSGPR